MSKLTHTPLNMSSTLKFTGAASVLILAAACTPSNTPENAETRTPATTISLNQAQLAKLETAETPASSEMSASVTTEANRDAKTMAAATETSDSDMGSDQPDSDNAEASTASGDTADMSDDEAPFKWMPQDGDVIDFKVLRKGNDFGYHRISFAGDPTGEMTVTSQVELSAGLGPIKVYTYDLEATETWEKGVLVGLEGQTNSDGDDLSVTATRESDQLRVEGTKYSGTVALGILPSSHWNIAQVSASQMLSTEDGELIEISGSEVGSETLNISGQDVTATQYKVEAPIDLDLWYDDQSRLVKLAFKTQGQDIEYVLSELY